MTNYNPHTILCKRNCHHVMCYRMMSPQGDRSFPTSEYNMFLYEELACGVAVTKTLPVERLEKQPSLGSLNNQTDQDSESVEGGAFILLSIM